MIFPDKATVEWVRADYPPGTRVVLEQMSDPQAPPIGTIGTVVGVDDAASLIMRWSNGSGLNVIFGEDRVRKVGAED